MMYTDEDGFLRYKTPAQAREALKRFTKESVYLIEGEVVSPAELWLMETIHMFLPIKKADQMRKEKRRLCGLARSLGLYPIPEWWEVRQRVLGRPNIKFLGFDYGRFEQMAALVETSDELLNDASALENYIKQAVPPLCTK